MGEWKLLDRDNLVDNLSVHYSHSNFNAGVDVVNAVLYIVPEQMGFDPSLKVVAEGVSLDSVPEIVDSTGSEQVYAWLAVEESSDVLFDEEDLKDLQESEPEQQAAETSNEPEEQEFTEFEITSVHTQDEASEAPEPEPPPQKPPPPPEVPEDDISEMEFLVTENKRLQKEIQEMDEKITGLRDEVACLDEFLKELYSAAGGAEALPEDILQRAEAIYNVLMEKLNS